MVTGQFSRTDFQSPLLDRSSDGTNLLRSAWVYLYGAQHMSRLYKNGITDLVRQISCRVTLSEILLAKSSLSLLFQRRGPKGPGFVLSLSRRFSSALPP